MQRIKQSAASPYALDRNDGNYLGGVDPFNCGKKPTHDFASKSKHESSSQKMYKFEFITSYRMVREGHSIYLLSNLHRRIYRCNPCANDSCGYYLMPFDKLGD